MGVNLGRFFRACNPSKTLNLISPDDGKYYIDFSAVRGSDLVRELKRTITFSDREPTCQLFTGHIGCGKSTELSRLRQELEDDGYHVVYFESTDDLDMGDVDISDILLAIAKQVSKSLEDARLRLAPNKFQTLLKSAADLLNSEVTGLKVKIPEVGGLKVADEVGLSAEDGNYSLAFGIGELTTKAKDSKDVRSLLRQHLEPRINSILDVINRELIDTANQQLLDQGKAGLVVIVDNLDRIDNKPRGQGRRQPEYLFVDRGDQLKKLRCHVVYTVPLVLSFSNEQENLTNRFGSAPQVLPMVRTQNRDGSPCKAGIDSLRQMLLARAFPELSTEERLAKVGELFDSIETLDRLCLASGGHVRNLLVLINYCLKKADPPFTGELLDRVISLRLSDLTKAIDFEEWDLLREVHRTKTVRGEGEYQALLRSLFVFEYRNAGQTWFALNPVLLDAEELKSNG
ncbi:P-loop NTPase family protein [Leptothoe spongobia]|uniref:AAA family ATPase n=1 Tax=Leptothoe spongobia TAU-MAC 1115 TaxID=1967444 RepID=A0A947DF73_9CYAN|nr:AAA family ATPase [Leptothoe spongobia]MBT9315299.1 AAA family ATPase [Leptothoe spongobia TAU-MAC 1115]